MRLPENGPLSGSFYAVQFKAKPTKKKEPSYYEKHWSYYTTDAFPITKDQGACWQKCGFYGFFQVEEAIERVKLARKRDNYLFRIVKVSYLMDAQDQSSSVKLVEAFA